VFDKSDEFSFLESVDRGDDGIELLFALEEVRLEGGEREREVEQRDVGSDRGLNGRSAKSQEILGRETRYLLQGR
jgi:hypothetical protein